VAYTSPVGSKEELNIAKPAKSRSSENATIADTQDPAGHTPSNGEASNGSPIRVLIADDHAMVREGLSSLLRNSGGFDVVAEVCDGAEAVTACEDISPQVALIDVRMTVLNGVDATARIVAAAPNTRVLAISAHDDASAIESMLKAGARGYILKDASVDEMLTAIRRVALGEYYLGAKIMHQVVDKFILGEYQNEAGMLSVLTPREREVAQLLSEGYSNRHIAKRLFVSVKTIDTHRYQVLKKLDLRGIADLTRLALREGLSSLDA
jgi:DNA-binding NarL/FixJ family response regulator